MTDQAADEAAIKSRYREYCDACQSGHLERLTEFWSLPALFLIEYGAENTTAKKIVETSAELEGLYANEFGRSTGIDKTTIDAQQVKFYGEGLATIETSLRHTVKANLHDRQHAIYSCSRIDGKWWFNSHVSKVEDSEHPA